MGSPHTRTQLHALTQSKIILAFTLPIAVFGLLALLTAARPENRNSPAGKLVEHSASAKGVASSPDPETKRRILKEYGKLPLSFEANEGQMDGEAKFIARGDGYVLFLTADGAMLKLRGEGKASGSRGQFAAMRMKLRGANPAPRVAPAGELPGKSNYFIGNDPAKWRTEVSRYARVEYDEVYAGVDLVYYGNQGQLEYDFVVAPGADPGLIQLAFEGAETIETAGNGDLILKTPTGELRQHKPVVYQEIAGQRQYVDGKFVIRSEAEVGFELGDYDASRPLVIDPVLSWATLLGGSQDEIARALAVDLDGNVYVTGATDSIDFPISPTAADMTKGQEDAYITKLNPEGTAVLYSTYIGGTTDLPGLPTVPPFPTQEESNGIAVDSNGNAYIVGTTASSDFPTTPNALIAPPVVNAVSPCPFVVRVNAIGSRLVYSTYLGGGGGVDVIERGTAIAVCEPGVAVVAGYSNSPGLAAFTTKGAFQETKKGNPIAPDGFIAKLDTNATSGPASNLYLTYLGGGVGVDDGVENIQSLTVDFVGNIYVAGDTHSTDFPTTPGAYDRTYNGGDFDVFISKICPVKSGAGDLVYSTYLGGSGEDLADGIALDGVGDIYVVGDTDSANFPTAKGYDSSYGGNEDAYLAKLTTTRTGAASLLYSTYLGGAGIDGAFGVAVDCLGKAYLVGVTSIFMPQIPVTDFPVTADAYDKTFNGVQDVFVSIINTLETGAASLHYSTFLGGSGEDAGFDIALDPTNRFFYIAGLTSSPPSSPFPTTPGAYQTVRKGDSDAFIVKFAGDGAPPCNAPVVSDQDAGSVLFYNLVTSNPVSPNLENTRIGITNTSQTESAIVHLFFVDGSNCSVADSYVCLTPNQTTALLANDIDPGVTGYVVAIASDADGCPIDFDYLIGDAYVKLATGHAANLPAEVYAAGKGCVDCKGSTTATLRFDGVNYSQAARVVAVDNLPSPTDGNSTLLVLNRFGGNLGIGAATIGSVFGLLFDDAETAFSFSFTGSCQFRNTLSGNFPRTTPRLPQAIPAGRSGWMKLWGADDVVLSGAAINFNPGFNGFNQGHNLHRLTLSRSGTLVIPVFPPSC